VTQISDDQGRQLYKTDADLHMSRTDLETDPNKRLKGAMRWPWFAQVDSRGAVGEPGELYFVRPAAGSTKALNFSISGTQYKAVVGVGGHLVQIDASSSGKAKDIITVSGLATAAQSVEIKTLGAQRSFDVRQLRGSTATRDWRSVEVKGLEVTRDTPVVIESIGDMEAVVVSSRDKTVSFNLDLKQRINGEFSSAKSEMLSTTPGKLLKVVPGNWRTLGTTTLDTVEMEKAPAPVPAEVR